MLIKKILIVFFFYFSSIVYAFSSNSIYNLDFDLIDKDNNLLKFSSLSGKVHVFSMFYTNCKTICPIIISNMKAIEKLIFLSGLTNINFSLVSLDPDNDSVSVLKRYFDDKNLNSNWNIYKTNKENTLKLALLLGIKYKKEKNNEYTHSNLVIIIDKEGIVRMYHQGLDKNFSNVIKLISSLN